MKLQSLTILTIGLLVGVVNAQNTPTAPTAPAAPAAPTTLTPPTNQLAPPKTDFSKIFKSDKEKNSYAVGMYYGMGLKAKLKAQDIECDVESIVKGFRDNVGDGPPLLTDAQEQEVLAAFNNEIKIKSDAKRKQMAEEAQAKAKQQAEENRVKGEKNKADGIAFLEKNKTASGVVTLPSGLQYKIITPGSGDSPKAEDEVSVNYRGTLIDGTEFDNSSKHNPPFVTRIQGGRFAIIKGWMEALQLMKPGAKWQLFIPADLAYGERGMPPAIGPDATLIFEIELLSFKPGASLPTPVATSPITPAVTPVANTSHVPSAPTAPLTSDIIKVPSAEGIKRGEKIETIKAEDIDKERAKSGNQ